MIDVDFQRSLDMGRVHIPPHNGKSVGHRIDNVVNAELKGEVGKFASWIAPPKVGINNQAGDFEYVQLHMDQSL